MRKTINRTIITCVLAVCLLALVPAAGNEPAFAGSKTPAKVTGLTIKVNAQPTATLQWKAVKKNTDGYFVYRDGKKLAKVKKGVTAYVDRSLKPGKTYSYTVKAFNKTKKKNLLGKSSAAKKIVKGFTWGKAKDGKAKITGYTGHQSNLSIPSKVNGKMVTEIGEEAFQGNLFIKKLKLPGSVKRIDDYAFETCSGMKKIYFPKSLKYIGNGAFSGCAQMRVADLEDGVTHIGDGAFLYCMGLSYIELPKDLKELGMFAFAGTSISKIWFDGDKLTYLPDRAFCNCKNLTEIRIPGSITSIGKRAFSGCDGLGSVTFAGSTIDIADYAFEKCDLKEVFFMDCVPTFGINIFQSANKDMITRLNVDINFPDTVFIPEPEEQNDQDDLIIQSMDDWGDLPIVVSKEIRYTSMAGGGIVDEKKYAGYLDINEGFDAWVEEYEKYNKDLPMTKEFNPYISLYTGNEHYRQMKAALNHDAGRRAYAVENSGDDFVPMYLMMDHGLSAELLRGKMPQDLLLYSGLKSEQIACFAGYPQGGRNVTVSMDELKALIGKDVMDEAFMSTTANVATAFNFAEEPANAIVKVYASQAALDHLGAVCVDPFSAFSGEREILFNSYAHYTVLDVGEAVLNYTMSDGSANSQTRTYISLELK